MFLDSPFFTGTHPFKIQSRTVYSDKALEADIAPLGDAWSLSQTSRDRDAIYPYLSAVFELVEWWTAKGHSSQYALRALACRGISVPAATDPFAAVIAASVHPKVLDKRLISKWSRALRFTATFKRPKESLSAFIIRRGGINACAEGYSHRLGRHSEK